MSPAQVAYWVGVHAALDRDESWRSHMEQNQLARRLVNGREARKYMEDLDGPIKGVLGELGRLKTGQ